MAEVDERRRESSPEIDMDRAGIDSVEWHLEQIELQRLARPTDKQKVANFVKVVEKAFQYFDFKDFLAKHYGLEQNAKYDSAFAHTLYDLPLQMNKFDALSSYDIGAAVEAHIASLKRARLLARQHQHQHHYEDAKSDTGRTPSPPKDPVSTLLDRLKEEDFYAFSAPTFRAVFLSRNRVYDMDLCPQKELQKIKSSPGYRRDYVIFDEPAAKWLEKGANAAIVVKKYEEACNKYRSLVLGLSKEAKAPKERRLSDEKRKREQHAKEEVKAPKERRMSDEKPKKEQHAKEEVKAPKERRMSDEKPKREQHAKEEVKTPKERRMSDEERKREQHAKEGGEGEKSESGDIVAKKYEEECNKYRSLVLGLPKEVKAPKERRMSDKKQMIAQHAKQPKHAKEGRKGRRVQKSLRR